MSTLSVSIMSDAEEVFTKIDLAVMEAVETTMRQGLLDEIQKKALSEV